MTTVLDWPVSTTTHNPHLEVHIICRTCNPDVPVIARCGARLRGIFIPRGTPLTCPVCDDLRDTPCSH